MVFRSQRLVFRSQRLVFRSQRLVFCSQRLVFRSHRLVFRSQRLVFRSQPDSLPVSPRRPGTRHKVYTVPAILCGDRVGDGFKP